MLNKIIDFQQNARLNVLFLKTLDKILADERHWPKSYLREGDQGQHFNQHCFQSQNLNFTTKMLTSFVVITAGCWNSLPVWMVMDLSSKNLKSKSDSRVSPKPKTRTDF